jgi:hypothetical protein
VHDAQVTGDAGQDTLGAAREAGEEVRLDEAGRDPQAGLDVVPVEPNLGAARCVADLDQAGMVVRVVVEAAVALDDGSPSIGAFGIGIRPVQAGGSTGDVLDRHASASSARITGSIRAFGAGRVRSGGR